MLQSVDFLLVRISQRGNSFVTFSKMPQERKLARSSNSNSHRISYHSLAISIRHECGKHTLSPSAPTSLDTDPESSPGCAVLSRIARHARGRTGAGTVASL